MEFVNRLVRIAVGNKFKSLILLVSTLETISHASVLLTQIKIISTMSSSYDVA